MLTKTAEDYLDPYRALLDEQLHAFTIGTLWSDDEWNLRRSVYSAALRPELPRPQQASLHDDQEQITSKESRFNWRIVMPPVAGGVILLTFVGLRLWPTF
jgi:hypothetical protein